jgi:hypothetical protein
MMLLPLEPINDVRVRVQIAAAFLGEAGYTMRHAGRRRQNKDLPRLFTMDYSSKSNNHRTMECDFVEKIAYC